MKTSQSAAYSDVDAILQQLLVEAQAVLGEQFVGLYLTGSLAAGDFNPSRSDIDFVVVTANELDEETVTALAAMHTKLRNNSSVWTTRLDGDYVPQTALRRYDPALARYPHLGDDGHFAVEQRGGGAIIQYHTLRENGIVIAGPPIRPLIDPISPDELRQATLEILHNWWQPLLPEPTILVGSDYQAYAVLTMCRILYTLQFGVIVSKPAAAKWAMGVVDGRFSSLIQQADAWQNGMPFDKLDETVDFIRYTLAAAS
ncbi:MAG: DUF4111 domain-containing protein [Ardenticatenaceae bacterium]|nr:DUF4111 domain-containing protein [Ardenticatenaceae bacterium]MCB9446205.1 DUF4111 domain-containing protein [Ardenticatenaceae bacterium]